jgi:DNA-directed RNA polymerase subunit RPC12/RpoP
VIYRCENCGTELLLLVKGTEAAPRHCGEHMARREEIRRA